MWANCQEIVGSSTSHKTMVLQGLLCHHTLRIWSHLNINESQTEYSIVGSSLPHFAKKDFLQRRATPFFNVSRHKERQVVLRNFGWHSTQRTTKRYILEDRTLHHNRCENLKFYKVYVTHLQTLNYVRRENKNTKERVQKAEKRRK
jgi:hypothetical protein